jgi:chemotaxis response regulator CheB
MDPQVGAHDIVVIGGSAGALAGLSGLFGAWSGALPAAVCLVVHHPAESDSLLPDVLRRYEGWEVEAVAGEAKLRHGHVYVAPSDGHLLVERGLVRIERGPKEGFFRPSVDALLRSAALAYGRRVAGVVLSGALGDGTAGLWQVKKRGGATLVQDPRDALFPGMPRTALDNVSVDFCLPADALGAKLAELATSAPSPPLGGSQAARVFIVEDERRAATGLERKLKDLGYEIAGSACSGERAIECVGRTSPDLVLMDICLSGVMDGTEAARRIWESFQTPTLYLTAHADDDTLDAVKETEHYGYVVKPVRPVELHAAIQLALARYEHEKETCPE